MPSLGFLIITRGSKKNHMDSNKADGNENSKNSDNSSGKQKGGT